MDRFRALPLIEVTPVIGSSKRQRLEGLSHQDRGERGICL